MNVIQLVTPSRVACNNIVNTQDQAIKQLFPDAKFHKISNMNADEARGFVKLAKYGDDSSVYNQFKIPADAMDLRHLSNSLKHYEALKRVVDGDSSWSLILEDDAVMTRPGMEIFKDVASSMNNSDIDMIMLGFPIQVNNNDKLLSSPFDVLGGKPFPSCESYMISKSAAKKLVDAYMPICFTTNIHLSSLIQKLKLNVMMCTPNIFVDGSKIGMVPSIINASNYLTWVNEYTALSLALNENNNEAFNKIWDELAAPLKRTIEFMTLRADKYVKDGDIKKAQIQYALVADEASKQGCLINKYSNWLNGYIDTYAKF